jgi:predicted GNAT family acetyltransferase
MCAMTEPAPEVRVADNPAKHRFEAHLGDRLAGFAVYRSEPGRVVFTHTEILPEFGGHGIGSRLAAAALDEVRARGLAVTPVCPFIAAFIDRHPEYADLVTRPVG